MSTIDIQVKDHILVIEKKRARKSEEDLFEIDLDTFTDENFRMRTNITVNKSVDTHRVLYQKIIGNKILLVFCGQLNLHIAYGVPELVYGKLLKPFVFSTHQRLSRKGLKIWYKGYVYNPFQIEYSHLAIKVDDENKKEINLKNSLTKIRKYKFLGKRNESVFYPMKDLLYSNASINCNIMVSMTIDGYEFEYPIASGYLKKGNRRQNYIPYQAMYYQGWALHLRKTRAGNLAFVRRLMEEKEKEFGFRIKESGLIDFFLYHIGNLKRKYTKKKVNLFYEKFASKSEEGAFDLFKKARNSTTSKNYFIIDPNSEDYQKIKDEKNVVRKWSWKYYWLLFCSDNFIATEAPIHINIVRSNNKYFRRSTFEKKFIFLQHGVTYLKRHGVNSPFVNGKEATPNYIVVGSEKEQDIVSDMLGLKEEQILVTGLPVFSNLKWENMNQDSPDKVTVMLTWKPYEEFITDFEMTTYYQYTKEIYELLKQYLPKDKIMIIPHPKIAHLMENTDFSENIWQGEISTALSQSKLLITDYSSVCYNSFYQGGGVVFYQPDLQLYEEENGKLIPEDDEYIGYRTFNYEELKDVIDQGLKDQKIDLSYFRTKEFVDRYLTINSFTDGRNLDRIDERLKELNII